VKAPRLRRLRPNQDRPQRWNPRRQHGNTRGFTWRRPTIGAHFTTAAPSFRSRPGLRSRLLLRLAPRYAAGGLDVARSIFRRHRRGRLMRGDNPVLTMERCSRCLVFIK
jgi:hypothetical protein